MKRVVVIALLVAVAPAPGSAGEEDVVGCTSWLGLVPAQARFTAPPESGSPAGYLSAVGIAGCSFVATKTGGYTIAPRETDIAAGYWVIRVERGDQVAVYARDRSPWCADGVLKRGDRVHVWAAIGASAGPESGCI